MREVVRWNFMNARIWQGNKPATGFLFALVFGHLFKLLDEI